MKIDQEKTAQNLSQVEKEKIFYQMQSLLEFTQQRISKKDNIVSITVSNETHSLTLKQK